MTNGSAQPSTPTADQAEETIVVFHLKKRHLAAVVTIMGGLMAGSGTAGIWWPASTQALAGVESATKQTAKEVAALGAAHHELKQQLTGLEGQVESLQGVNGEIVNVVRELRGSVAELTSAVAQLPAAAPTAAPAAALPAIRQAPRRSAAPKRQTAPAAQPQQAPAKLFGPLGF